MRLAYLLAIFALACGPKTHGPKLYKVEIRAMAYAPDALRIELGDTVEWTNYDLVPHSVTGSAFDSASIAPKQTWKFTATKRGDFAYHCTFHNMMVGAIIVE